MEAHKTQHPTDSFQASKAWEHCNTFLHFSSKRTPFKLAREYIQTADGQAAFTVRRANTLVQEEVPDPTTLLTGEALSLLFAQNGRAAERKELRVCESEGETGTECERGAGDSGEVGADSERGAKKKKQEG